uniref:Uncharacterized protein n=1 Tax=Opuntia streptacantha TaxID=393608 RepID=A0A7C8YHR9_OPUST
MLFWSNTKLVVEGVVPNLLHVIPVAHNTMLNWVLQCQNTSFRLSFISNIRILLAHTNHYTSMSGTTDDTWKDCPWSIIPSKPGLDHSSSIVTDEGLNLLCVSHFSLYLKSDELEAARGERKCVAATAR